MLFEVYNAVKGTDFEEAVWRSLILLYGKPLPKEVAFDLIDRMVALLDLGHSKQEYEVLWKLAEVVDEALLALAIDVYTNISIGINETELLFNKFHVNRWMLETLIYIEPSSPEKRKLLESAILKNMDSDPLQSLLTVVDNAKLASRSDLTIEQFHFLFETKEPFVWLSLSQNANTPVDILNQLAEVADVKNARQIRHSASVSLRKQNY